MNRIYAVCGLHTFIVQKEVHWKEGPLGFVEGDVLLSYYGESPLNIIIW